MPDRPYKGRGTALSPDNRFAAWSRASVADEWWPEETTAAPTRLIVDSSKTAIVRNRSPDVPFDRSINPYRGCEHGCIYCYARPSHAYLGFSPGLDFETRIVYKPGIATLLRRELARPGYRPRPIAIGSNTDCYQPVERRLGLTRGILDVLLESAHPAHLITKSAGILRDLDILRPLARDQLLQAMISITTLDPDLARRLEPRAATPQRRLEVIAQLTGAGIPTGVLFAPAIPALNDHELENVLAAAAAAGAQYAVCTVLRLPRELSELFADWLTTHRPERARHVLSMLAQMHAQPAARHRFGSRMTGNGPLAKLLADRLRLAQRRFGYRQPPPLACDRFHPPDADGRQGSLF